MNHRTIFGGVVAMLLAATYALPVSGQSVGSWTWNLQYSTVLGTGTTADYAGGFSWRGVTVDAERVLSDNLTVGLTSGWHVLNDKGSGTLQSAAGAITGTAFRYVNSIPILLTGNYFLGQNGAARPFLGVGAGTYWIENRTEAGIFAVEDTNWHLGFMGEAGVVLTGMGSSDVTLSARYNWGLEANDIERQYFTFSIGYVVEP